MSRTEKASGHAYHDILTAGALDEGPSVAIALQRQEGGNNTSTFGGKMTPAEAVAFANLLLWAAQRAEANSRS